jgi:protein kinase-like protein/WD40 repeat protein
MLTPGSRIGGYEILGSLGAGGMGEVYRGRDSRLKRDVALKILPEAFANDPERLARFQREAEVLASLSHPNIAGIYGLESSEGIRALVMELVEGEDLSQRIARGPIPLDEALPIAKQIAEALEAAHEQGVVHRDLKPANIKVRPDGTVKVLDFGLAKLTESPSATGSSALSISPTITSPAMAGGVGVLLGTAAYMSPEQAKGKPANKRSDIWAFGCVLFEMLAGRRAFEDEDLTVTLSKVLQREPDFDALPPSVPRCVIQTIRVCLRKDAKQRAADIRDVRLAMEGAFDAAVPQTRAPSPATDSLHVFFIATALLVGAIVAGVLVWFATRPEPTRVSRTYLGIGGTTALTIFPSGRDRDIAITPDGSRVLYVGNNGTQLFIRALDSLEPVSLFTGAPHGLFMSPDGQWVGFIDGNLQLKKVAVTGGPAVMIGTLDSNSAGATWGPDDDIIFATQTAATGLQRIGAGGGSASVLTRPDRSKGEGDHFWPELLPGGQGVLFTIRALTGGVDADEVAVLDLRTGNSKVLVRGGSHGHYVSTGHLVYAAAGTLRAVSFDLARLETRGTPVPVVPAVLTTFLGAADAVVADDGTLVYVSGANLIPGEGVPRFLVWVDRSGHETPIPAPPRPYLYPRLAPDGSRIALRVVDDKQDLWIWDLARQTLTRATFDAAPENWPVWTPDSRRLIFSSERSGARNLFWQPADGTGTLERLTDSRKIQNGMNVTPDGKRLIFTENGPNASGVDLMQLTLDDSRRVSSLVRSPFSERNAVVSPDGRWLAYEADDSGRFEIHVRPFPDVDSGHWQLTTDGGTQPLWAPNGQELFYVSPTGGVMRINVPHGSIPSATSPVLLLNKGYLTVTPGNTGRSYDVSRDGQRFLMIKEGIPNENAARPQIVVVQHFDQELKRLVPAK